MYNRISKNLINVDEFFAPFERGIVVNVENFKSEVLCSPVPVAVYFHSSSSNCEKMEKVFDEASSMCELVKFVKVDVNKFPEVSDSLDIVELPDVSVFVDSELKGSSVGVKTISQLQDLLVYSVNR